MQQLTKLQLTHSIAPSFLSFDWWWSFLAAKLNKQELSLFVTVNTAYNIHTNVLRTIYNSTCIRRNHEEDFVGAKFYCLHALADDNYCIRIRDKMLEFSSTVLSTPSPYRVQYTTQWICILPLSSSTVCGIGRPGYWIGRFHIWVKLVW